jgi:hypothetical protein
MLGLAQYVHGNTITPFEKLILICSYIGETNLWTAGLSLASLTWLIGARLFKQHLRAKIPALKYIPEIFILVVVSTSESRLSRPKAGVNETTDLIPMVLIMFGAAYSRHGCIQARPQRDHCSRQARGGFRFAVRFAFPA